MHEIFFYNGNFYPVDTEQPNNSNRNDFFHLNKAKYDWNVMTGLEAIAYMLERNSDQWRFFKELVLNDTDIQQNTFYSMIVEKFADLPTNKV